MGHEGWAGIMVEQSEQQGPFIKENATKVAVPPIFVLP